MEGEDPREIGQPLCDNKGNRGQQQRQQGDGTESGGVTLQSLIDEASDFLLGPTSESQQSSLADHDLMAWFHSTDAGVLKQFSPSIGSCSASKRSVLVPGRTPTVHSADLGSAIDGKVKLEIEEEKDEEDDEEEDEEEDKGKAVVERSRIPCQKIYWDEKRRGTECRPYDRGDTAKSTAHSHYERKRREKINQRMKTLQKLVPNSHQSDDKASVLDKAIDHIRNLQSQGKITSNVTNSNNYNSTPHKRMQMMQQQLRQSGNMAMMGMGMPMGGMMDMKYYNQQMQSGMAMPAIFPSMVFPCFQANMLTDGNRGYQNMHAPNPVPMDMGMFNRMAAFFQQQQRDSLPPNEPRLTCNKALRH